MNLTQIAVAAALAAVMAATAAEKKPADKKKSSEKPKVTAPRNQAKELIQKAQRPSMVGVVHVSRDAKGFVKAKLEAEDGQSYAIINPGSVEELDGQKVKIIYADLKADAKTKTESLRVEEVQKLAR